MKAKKWTSISELQEGIKDGTIKSDNIGEVIPVDQDEMVPIPILSPSGLAKNNKEKKQQ